MFDLKILQKQPDVAREALRRRGSDLNLDDFLALDNQRRALLAEVESLKSERNKASQDVAKAKRAGDDAQELIAELGKLSERIKELDARTVEVDAQVKEWLLALPNVPHSGVPDGLSENDNVQVAVWGERPSYDFEPKEHWELGTALGGLDFERAGRISGSRFAVYWGWAARLERALISFFLDLHTSEHGYREVMPPAIVNRAAMTGTGQLPKFEADLFKLEGWDHYLIPTAEVPVTNLHAGEVLDEAQLPVAYAAYTPCFRSEAGSYGKDVKGIIRQHQFNKVELVRFAHPDRSYDELELLRSHAEQCLRRLGLHYRVVALCAGDLGFSAAKTYDLEVWLPGQGKYREISSCSNFEDFQARRADIRYRPKGSNKSLLAHTLNGSGLAVGRTVVAIIETFQRADGGLDIPEVLRPYMGGLASVDPA